VVHDCTPKAETNQEMNIKHITADIAIDTETVEVLASNKSEGSANRTLYKALTADQSRRAFYYVETTAESNCYPKTVSGTL
jgi:hypothetical protein